MQTVGHSLHPEVHGIVGSFARRYPWNVLTRQQISVKRALADALSSYLRV